MSTSAGDAGYGEGDDRLPWLETVDEEYREPPSMWRVLMLVLLGLAVLAAGIFGYYWYQRQQTISGTGELIKAQEGDYKVKPDEPGGMKVDGEGDTVFATSEGTTTNAAIDAGAVPEAPVKTASGPAAKTAAPGTARVVTEVPAASGTLAAKAPGAAAHGTPRQSSAGGSLVQLGSFPAESGANTAWTRLSKRFAYLAPLGKSVERAEVNGRTMYRLRVNAGSNGQAHDICGKLKVAGEACFVAN